MAVKLFIDKRADVTITETDGGTPIKNGSASLPSWTGDAKSVVQVALLEQEGHDCGEERPDESGGCSESRGQIISTTLSGSHGI